MRNKLTYTLLCLLVCLICIPAKAQVSFGKAENFNEGWLFNLKDDSLSLQTDYDDSKWRKLDLPHDWSIEGLPSNRQCSAALHLLRRSIQPERSLSERTPAGKTPERIHFIYV